MSYTTVQKYNFINRPKSWANHTSNNGIPCEFSSNGCPVVLNTWDERRAHREICQFTSDSIVKCTDCAMEMKRNTIKYHNCFRDLRIIIRDTQEKFSKLEERTVQQEKELQQLKEEIRSLNQEKQLKEAFQSFDERKQLKEESVKVYGNDNVSAKITDNAVKESAAKETAVKEIGIKITESKVTEPKVTEPKVTEVKYKPNVISLAQTLPKPYKPLSGISETDSSGRKVLNLKISAPKFQNTSKIADEIKFVDEIDFKYGTKKPLIDFDTPTIDAPVSPFHNDMPMVMSPIKKMTLQNFRSFYSSMSENSTELTPSPDYGGSYSSFSNSLYDPKPLSSTKYFLPSPEAVPSPNMKTFPNNKTSVVNDKTPKIASEKSFNGNVKRNHKPVVRLRSWSGRDD